MKPTVFTVVIASYVYVAVIFSMLLHTTECGKKGGKGKIAALNKHVVDGKGTPAVGIGMPPPPPTPTGNSTTIVKGAPAFGSSKGGETGKQEPLKLMKKEQKKGTKVPSGEMLKTTKTGIAKSGNKRKRNTKKGAAAAATHSKNVVSQKKRKKSAAEVWGQQQLIDVVSASDKKIHVVGKQMDDDDLLLEREERCQRCRLQQYCQQFCVGDAVGLDSPDAASAGPLGTTKIRRRTKRMARWCHMCRVYDQGGVLNDCTMCGSALYHEEPAEPVGSDNESSSSAATSTDAEPSQSGDDDNDDDDNDDGPPSPGTPDTVIPGEDGDVFPDDDPLDHDYDQHHSSAAYSSSSSSSSSSE